MMTKETAVKDAFVQALRNAVYAAHLYAAHPRHEYKLRQREALARAAATAREVRDDSTVATAARLCERAEVARDFQEEVALIERAGRLAD